jgi:phosphoribosylformylglycinamidine synthase
MLAIVTPASWPAVAEICAKWEVLSTVIGKVVEPDPERGGRYRILDGFDGEVLADIPAASLSDDAPLYHRPLQAPAPMASAPPAPPVDCEDDLLSLLRSPRWVFSQYDHQLFLNTVVGPGGDAALLRLAGPGLPPSERGWAPSGSWPRGWPTWPASGPRRWRWSIA